MVHISITSEKITEILGLSITNTLLTAWLVVILLIALAFIVRKQIRTIPNTLQNIAELIIENLLNFMATVAGSRERAEKFFPFVATIFIFILTANWIGILPGVGPIGFHEGGVFVPLFRSANADLTMTLALALIVVTVGHIVGLATVGVRGHLGKFFNFHGPINFFAGILEIISEFARVLSFSFRLFGNVFAGEVLLAIVGFLVPYIAPIPFLGMELFVGFIQALIFSVLAMVMLSSFSEAHH